MPENPRRMTPAAPAVSRQPAEPRYYRPGVANAHFSGQKQARIGTEECVCACVCVLGGLVPSNI